MTYPPQQPPRQPGYGMPQPYPGGYPAGPPGPPPGPPPKKNTGLIVGIVAAVVLIVGGVLITGFVAPGFFLSDEKKDDDDRQAKKPTGQADAPPGQDTPGGESLDVPGGSGEADAEQVKRVAQQAVESINNRDAELAKSVSCDPAGAGDMSKLPEDAHAEVTGEPLQVGSTAFKVPVNFSAKGNSGQDFLELAEKDGRWCVEN